MATRAPGRTTAPAGHCRGGGRLSRIHNNKVLRDEEYLHNTSIRSENAGILFHLILLNCCVQNKNLGISLIKFQTLEEGFLSPSVSSGRQQHNEGQTSRFFEGASSHYFFQARTSIEISKNLEVKLLRARN